MARADDGKFYEIKSKELVGADRWQPLSQLSSSLFRSEYYVTFAAGPYTDDVRRVPKRDIKKCGYYPAKLANARHRCEYYPECNEFREENGLCVCGRNRIHTREVRFYEEDAEARVDGTWYRIDPDVIHTYRGHPVDRYMYRVRFSEGPLANKGRTSVDKENIQPAFKKITAANEHEYRNRRDVVEASKCELGSKITLSFYRVCPGCGQVSRMSWHILPEKAVIVAKITELSERIKRGEYSGDVGHQLGYYCDPCDHFHKDRRSSDDDMCEKCGNQCIWELTPTCKSRVAPKWTAVTMKGSRETVMLMPCQHQTLAYEKEAPSQTPLSFLGRILRKILPENYLPLAGEAAAPPCPPVANTKCLCNSSSTNS